MKTFKSSDLTHKRAEVMREAAENGVIIQECRSNGEVIREFILKEHKGKPVDLPVDCRLANPRFASKAYILK